MRVLPNLISSAAMLQASDESKSEQRARASSASLVPLEFIANEEALSQKG